MNQAMVGDVRFFLASVLLGTAAAFCYDLLRVWRRFYKEECAYQFREKTHTRMDVYYIRYAWKGILPCTTYSRRNIDREDTGSITASRNKHA